MSQPEPPAPTDRRRLLRGLASLPLAAKAAPATAAGPERPWHHLADGTFRNPPGSPVRGGDGAAWRAFLYRRLVAPPAPPPLPEGHVLPAAAMAAGLASAAPDSVTWLGHAAFLVRIGGRGILIDPYLSERASPFGFFGPRRFAGPALPPERLREVAPEVRAACEAHGVPYRTDTWGRTLARALRHVRALGLRDFTRAMA